MNLTVGPQQLARSILILAAGDRSELEQVFESGFRSDPRDVIMAAMAMSGDQAVATSQSTSISNTGATKRTMNSQTLWVVGAVLKVTAPP